MGIFDGRMGCRVVEATMYYHRKKMVGGLEHLDYFSIQLGIILPFDFHIFQRGRAQPPTRSNIIYMENDPQK